MAATTYRQIFGTGYQIDSTGINVTIYMVNWLVAPASLIKPLPSFQSVIPSSSVEPYGYTQSELTALQSGLLVEKQDSFQMTIADVTSGGGAAIESAALARYTQNQSSLNAQANTHLAHIVGAYLAADGVTWTAGP